MSTPEFEEFAAAHVARALRLALVLTGDRHDAWDLTQETLVRVAERWHRLEGSPEAYAKTVMVRLNIDRIRRLRRELVTADVPDHAVEAAFDARHLPAWLTEGLKSLTPRQRTAIGLRCVEDLDLAAIANRMDCSVGTVKSHLSRGAARMREYAHVASSAPARS